MNKYLSNKVICYCEDHGIYEIYKVLYSILEEEKMLQTMMTDIHSIIYTMIKEIVHVLHIMKKLLFYPMIIVSEF